MANIKAALKSIRQNHKRRGRNIAILSELKTLTKKYLGLLADGQREGAFVLLRSLARKLDVATRKGILHPNNASRRKSRLMKKLSQLKMAA